MFVTSASDHPIDQIRAGLMAAIGGEDSTELSNLVERQMTIAKREIEQIPERAQNRGDEFVELAKVSMEGLLGALREYRDWLEAVAEGLRTSDTSVLVSSYESSHETLPRLNSAMDAYGKVFASYGSYRSPWANTIDRIAEAIRAGDVPSRAWREVIVQSRTGLTEKSSSSAAVPLPGRTALSETYREALDTLESLKGVEPQSEGAVAAALKALDDRLGQAEMLETLIGSSLEAPTKIPAANVLIALAEKLLAGELSDRVAETCFDDYSEVMEQFSEGFEGSLSRPVDSALVQEEIPKTLDIIDAHYQALEDLIAALEENLADKAREQLEKLVETAKQLDESRQVYEAAAQHQNHVLCPSCGRSNPPENRVCEACGEQLPRAEDPSALASSTFSMVSGPALEESQQLVMTENVARLFEACDAIYLGQISDQQFAEELKLAATGLKEYAQELDEIAATAMDETNFTEEQLAVWKSQHLPYLEDVALAFTQGISEAEEGLRSMELYFQDRNEQCLIDGVRMVWEGLGSVHRGYLSLSSYNEMLQDVMEEAAEEGLLTEG